MPIVQGITVQRVRGIGDVRFLQESSDYIIFRERGIIHILEGAVDVRAGDTIRVQSYSVYTGLIAELQGLIEGSAGVIASGYRAAGTSVRVLPAPVQRVDLDVMIVAVEGSNLSVITAQVSTDIAAFLSVLGAGRPVYIARIIESALGVEGVENASVYKSDTNTPASDIYPNNPTTVLRG
jgi:hypothetical protein